jgi:hypothetical protein
MKVALDGTLDHAPIMARGGRGSLGPCQRSPISRTLREDLQAVTDRYRPLQTRSGWQEAQNVVATAGAQPGLQNGLGRASRHVQGKMSSSKSVHATCEIAVCQSDETGGMTRL